MFWPVSLPFVHGELCVRVQQGPAFQIWAFRESEREDLQYCTSITVYAVFDFLLFWSIFVTFVF